MKFASVAPISSGSNIRNVEISMSLGNSWSYAMLDFQRLSYQQCLRTRQVLQRVAALLGGRCGQQPGPAWPDESQCVSRVGVEAAKCSYRICWYHFRKRI